MNRADKSFLQVAAMLLSVMLSIYFLLKSVVLMNALELNFLGVIVRPESQVTASSTSFFCGMNGCLMGVSLSESATESGISYSFINTLAWPA